MATPAGLTGGEVSRYSRQMLAPGFGVQAQMRLKSSSILLVGCGGLGSIIAMYLAGSGVGRLGLVDNDTVELSNLHRQIIHSEAKVGNKKVISAAERVSALNSDIEVETHTLRLNAENVLEVMKGYDVVVDATDNPSTRYIINDACVFLGKPLVSGSAIGFEGTHFLSACGYALCMHTQRG